MSNAKHKPFWFSGYYIEYSHIQKRWFVCDYDPDNGYSTIGPSHPNKYSAMDWCCGRGL